MSPAKGGAPFSTLFSRRVLLRQPARGEGYRANVDALLLAAFANRTRPQARCAFDLGAGSGAVALSLLHLGVARAVVLVEVDAAAAAFARENLDANGWSDRGEVVTGDVRAIAETRGGQADLVVCNPPYVAPGRGRVAAGPRGRARQGNLGDFVTAARTLIGRRGRCAFVYPAAELVTLFETARAAGLEPKRARLVHASLDAPARVALLEAQPGRKGGLVIEPPLIERRNGRASDEIAALLRAEGARRT